MIPYEMYAPLNLLFIVIGIAICVWVQYNRERRKQ